jgi:hypothetical protein
LPPKPLPAILEDRHMPPLVDGRTRLFAEVSCVQDVKCVRH